MKRVLITGASGFTGRFLAKALADKGLAVFGSGATAPASWDCKLAGYFEADLGEPGSAGALVREVRPDGVIHLAGIAFVGHGDVSEIYHTNVVGTRNLLQALVESDTEISSVILASSANVYGNAREGALDEAMPFNPVNDYAASKAAMELVANVYRERLPITITRPFNYTGRGQSIKFLIPKIVDHARRRAPAIELGNLDVFRDFSDVRVVVEAYSRLLTTPAAVGRTVNICSGRCYSLREILALVAELSGHDMMVSVNPEFVRQNEVHVMKGDPSLLETLVGSLEMPPIRDTLSWMLDG